VRPSKLTPEITKRIAAHVREGLPYASAAALEGVSERTFYDWMARGKEQSSGKFLQFSQCINRANAELHKELSEKFLNDVRQGDVTAERFLARRFRTDWSEQRTHEITTPEGPISLSVSLGRKLHTDDN
tara:strand:- start:232 stop:618 length:387 start_codon:yes stop_codon:yes gene_type:complete